MGTALFGLLGNAAGFGGSGAADIPALVPAIVFGISAAVSLIASVPRCASTGWSRSAAESALSRIDPALRLVAAEDQPQAPAAGR